MFKKFLGLFRSRTTDHANDEVPDCASQRAPQEEVSRVDYEDLKVAVMRAMWPLPDVNPSFLLTKADQPRLDRAVKRCAEWRLWATNEPSLDKQTRQAYLEWCVFCERQNQKAQEEITHGWQKKSHAAYKARQAEKDARTRQITVTKPSVKI